MCKTPESTKDLLERAHEGDEAARERLITENMGLIWSMCRRFAGRGHEAEDLFQIGSIGLIKAVDRFDTSYDVCFSTYAVPMICGEIKRFLRDDGMIKVSRSLKDNAVKAQRAREKLRNELGTEPTLEGIAREAGLGVEDVVLCLEASYEVESINRAICQQDGSEVTVMDRLADRCEPGTASICPENEWKDYEKEKLVDSMVLNQELSGLAHDDRKLIWLRYYREWTQTQVAREMGMSQVQVSRTEKRILLYLRARMQA
jgi:RNA polymerase sporulation-specific sigma factor